MFEEEDDDDKPDIDVDNWMKRINEGYTVFFEDIYEDDIAAQKLERVMKILDKFEGRVGALESFVKEAQKGSKKK
ncbi:hypothetical protein DY000_02006349 [Brassica cretica]|uniref:DUF287 domain-containing protein n=1 Tax=Brassica cretica TaxID=69181 RepID=A0ABQ7CKB6_BRACR|nr:hypothetical protein DY000_02006349 [Brassica cretica]